MEKCSVNAELIMRIGCIIKNRLGASKCTSMYVREEDIFRAIYHQLKLYLNKHFISNLQYKQELSRLNNEIDQFDQQYQGLLITLFSITKNLFAERLAKRSFG